MPHSSGGGSHGGGSHGGSGGSYVPKVSDTYRQGYHRFVMYTGHRPRYFYSDKEVIKPSDTKFSITDAMIWLMYPALFLMILIPSWSKVPEKLPLTYLQTNIVIQDNTDLLSDREEQELLEVFKRFQDETGITPALVTFRNDTWKGRATSFENYAYSTYLMLFDDECHWLICYSSDPDSTGYDDWYWEGMQGDNTDPILTKSITQSFTKKVHSYLSDRDHYTVGEAFIRGFWDIEPKLMKRGPDSSNIWLGAFSIGMCVLGIVLTYRNKKKLAGMDGALRCPTDTFPVTEDTCTYCGGVYVRGIHEVCPYCGAPIPQEDEDREPKAED